MTQFVNNIFETITNSTNPQYAGVPSVLHTATPSYFEGANQSLGSSSNGLTPTPGSGALFNGQPI